MKRLIWVGSSGGFGTHTICLGELRKCNWGDKVTFGNFKKGAVGIEFCGTDEYPYAELFIQREDAELLVALLDQYLTDTEVTHDASGSGSSGTVKPVRTIRFEVDSYRDGSVSIRDVPRQQTMPETT